MQIILRSIENRRCHSGVFDVPSWPLCPRIPRQVLRVSGFSKAKSQTGSFSLDLVLFCASLVLLATFEKFSVVFEFCHVVVDISIDE